VEGDFYAPLAYFMAMGAETVSDEVLEGGLGAIVEGDGAALREESSEERDSWGFGEHVEDVIGGTVFVPACRWSPNFLGITKPCIQWAAHSN
jgi:hypothetical protein